MTEELFKYLERSRESRNQMKKIAKKIQNSKIPLVLTNESYSEEVTGMCSRFPSLNHVRFKRFEDKVNSDLKHFFLPKNVNKLKRKKKSNSHANLKDIRRPNSNLIAISKRYFISLTPTKLKKHKPCSASPTKLNKNKPCSAVSVSTRVALKNQKPNTINSNSRFDMKKKLLVPVLKCQKAFILI